MSRIWESLFSKNGLAAKGIAKELIDVNEGDRIPRVEDFVQKLSFGRGTIQGGLNVLERLHAITLESRGHLGTFLMNKDIHILKEIAGIGSLMGAMPLPYSTRYEGLATGLIEVSDVMHKRLDLAYMRGSKQRLEGLKSRRYDFVVMSKLAAEEEMKHNDNLQVAINFGPKTYVTAHEIFLADPSNNQIKDGMRVGIDFSSIDQSKITLLECDKINVELVPINYMQLFENLQNGSLDAAVWNADERRTNKTFKKVGFRTKEANMLSEKASTSVILIEKDRTDVHDFLLGLETRKIIEIQELVVNKKKLPHY
ncbi:MULTISPECIES: GntR family transcriptional regulator YhfZ [Virgibacillus]|uniref:Helix-turn-helix domain-containing protein n=1 Tax=Virgibacillus chiguensis TaxID=411959 RepID=A0A1M5RER2_9BACI|nr:MULTISPECIES: GntR family transcriptional regulator YhfZ [Virgibacillus]NWO13474.1 transcriptional regulator [Virgibacillus sp.]SHH24852.1 Helix-turn-helix domain-containing protein [Virgibacillus chiguensis]